MSDAEDSGFDKEAERERLREKYEREKDDRAAAEQMSDLLLKGATMTNAHCGECGSPIFRVDGQEFCPNCSQEAAEAGDEASVDAGHSTDAGSAAASDQSAPDEQLRDVVASDQDAADASGASGGGTSIAERAAESVRSGEAGDAAGQSGDAAGGAAPSQDPGASAGASPGASDAPSPQGDATLADAQQSLLNAITRHARAAAAADPRTARDHLEAANEAAEALAEISPEN